MRVDKIRAISDNDLHVIMTQCLDAAKSIQIAMCRFDEDHAAQRYLNDAMHSALVGAEQCRQLHKSPKHRLTPPEFDDGDDASALSQAQNESGRPP